MAALNLLEAAEQAATSKIDIWRAIQDGALPAQKTSDGGYAIDPTDLFRVFEAKQPEPRPRSPEPTPPPEEARSATTEGSGSAAANDVAVAFAALQAELKSLLGSTGEAGSVGEEKRRDEPKKRLDVLAEQDTRPNADLAVHKAEAEGVIAEAADKVVSLAEPSRPWWRRLMS